MRLLSVFRPLGRVMVRRPADTLGVCVASALVFAIVLNAVALQAGPHPAPLMPRSEAPAAAAPAPAPQKMTTGSLVGSAPPAAAPAPAREPQQPVAPKRSQLLSDIQKELARLGYYDGTVDGLTGPKTAAAIRAYEQAAKQKLTGEPSEALLKSLKSAKTKAASVRPPETTGSIPTRKIVAIQRALTDFGYGPVPPTGTVDEATKKAIEKFERDRKLPVRGQITESFVQALAAATGRTFG
jgi:peptidoglycan hydrolase-like protein with peptidoglycan-binding domain